MGGGAIHAQFSPTTLQPQVQEDYDPAQVVPDVLTPADVTVAPDDSATLSIPQAEKVWVTFHVTIPPEKTVPIEV